MMWLVVMLVGCREGGLLSPDNPYDSCQEYFEIACGVCDVGGICDYDDDERDAQISEKCEANQRAHDEGNVVDGYEWDRANYSCFNDAYRDTCDEVAAAEECFDLPDTGS